MPDLCKICGKKRLGRANVAFVFMWLFSAFMLSFICGAIVNGAFGAMAASSVVMILVAVSMIAESKQYCQSKCGGFENWMKH